jgi:DHA2 family multidrug resistance protein-like MFS transporter
VIFWVSFALSFLSILFVAGLKEDLYPHTEPRPRFIDTLKSIPGIVLGDKNYGRFLLTRAFLASATLGFGFVVVDGLDGSLVPSDAAALAAVFILSQAVIGFLLGVLGNYRGWRIVFVLGAVLILGGMLGAIVASSLVTYIAVFVLLGGANAVTVIGDPNMSIEMAPTSRTSLYLGATSTLLAPFFIVGPLVAGLLVPVVGYSFVFGLSATLGVVGLVLAFRVQEPRTVVEGGSVSAIGQPGAQP